MARKSQENDTIDRLGSLVLRAAAEDDGASQAAAESPFLFTRVRARIAEEERRRSEVGSWFSLLLIARRAVPAMALIALLAATVMFWSSGSGITPGWNRLDDEALSDTRNPGVEQTVLSKNNLSRDDVFSLVLEQANGRSDR
ncbi:MAG TPA: hypothetical protein VJT71_05860 [Pyrinomonadaceae bacterium]|nr:hypothetical protein [Pyrinomonadaceae bacterium]